MSYSFSVRGASKNDVLAEAKSKFDEVVAGERMHERDRPAALAAAEAFVGMLRDPGDGEVVVLTMYGSVGWEAEGALLSSGVSVSASVQRAPN